ncbi:MAG: monovalent cation/H(+) antiporter subunit G, partial [Anaerolineae bacterium]
ICSTQYAVRNTKLKTMQAFFEFIAILAVLAGTAFSVLGVLGFIRMPDVYTRLHAAGKVSVFGVVLLLLATVALTPLGFGKGLVLIALLVIGGPATSHAIGSAAHRIGIPLKGAIRDDLAQLEADADSQSHG